MTDNNEGWLGAMLGIIITLVLGVVVLLVISICKNPLLLIPIGVLTVGGAIGFLVGSGRINIEWNKKDKD